MGRVYAWLRTHILFLLAMCGVVPTSAEAAGQVPLRVYISADMEGVAGLISNRQFSENGADYAMGRRLMTGEVNAAIEGAFLAGATEVVVNDGHGAGMNLLPDELDRRALLITGAQRPFAMMEGLDGSYAAVVMVGYHARAGTASAVMDHTNSGNIRSLRLDDVEVGEFGFNAALAAHYGVPVAFVSGDRALVEEATALLPNITVVAVKDGLGTTAARSLSPAVSRERIRERVASAIRRRPATVNTGAPSRHRVTVELQRSSQADLAMMVPGMERVNARTVRYAAPDMPAAYRMFRLIVLLAATDQL